MLWLFLFLFSHYSFLFLCWNSDGLAAIPFVTWLHRSWSFSCTCTFTVGCNYWMSANFIWTEITESICIWRALLRAQMWNSIFCFERYCQALWTERFGARLLQDWSVCVEMAISFPLLLFPNEYPTDEYCLYDS